MCRRFYLNSKVENWRTAMKNKSEKKITELVYTVRYADGYEEVRFVPETEVEKGGGVAVFESELRKSASWFYPLGKTGSLLDGHGGRHVSRHS
jgi:hypothetical protein